MCTARMSANMSEIEEQPTSCRESTLGQWPNFNLTASNRFPHSTVLWRRLLSAPLTPSDEGARRQQRARARVLCRSLGAASGWLEHWRALCRGTGAGSVCGCGCNEDASVYLSQRHAYQGHSVDAESAGLGHRYRIIEPLPFLIAGSLVIDAVSTCTLNMSGGLGECGEQRAACHTTPSAQPATKSRRSCLPHVHKHCCRHHVGLF